MGEKLNVTPETEMEKNSLNLEIGEDSAKLEEIRANKCPHCGKWFKKKYRLSRHIFMEHVKPTCTVCDASFNRMKQLKEHAKDNHDLKMNKLCPVCKKAYTKRSDLDNHFEVEHTKDRMHQCSKCPRRFSSEEGLELHTLKHRKLNAFPCFDCSKSFGAPYHLEKHRRDFHSTSKTLHCPDCGEEFVADAELRNKICQLHSEIPPLQEVKEFVCKYCDESFSWLRKMNAHIRAVHSDKRPFKCDTCNFAFETAEELEKHTARHKDKDQHNCELCGRVFLALKALKNHRIRFHDEFPGKKVLITESVVKEIQDITLSENVPTQIRNNISETPREQEE